uniref:C2 domain-containing protein n=1 Tax=Hemiselmis andersenii TaxID=464988 RepID=A0A6T8N7Q9_HEMAN|mmetsp:Transcript_25729/g.59682  ORF Transcript_25729/g.59682 Transcript_25729/m.59682 type:complete len:1510 (+) Transcript_25729:226-4755(+)
MAAQVAAVEGARRRRGAQRRRVFEDPLALFNNKNDVQIQAGRVHELDDILKAKVSQGFFSLDGISRSQLKKELRVEELMVHVQNRLYRTERYLRFFSVLIFFIVFIIALYLQRTPPTAFAVESSFQQALLGSLPKGEEGSQFISSENDIYDWLDQKLFSQIFTEPQCGDGFCERDKGETEGFGRFGCIEDCGRYLKTTQLTIKLEDWVQSTKTSLVADETADSFLKLDLTKMKRTLNPEYRFNIFSETMRDYIFAQDMPCNDTYLVDVPDGKHTLHFYQTNKLSERIDTADMYRQILTVPSTLPERNSTNDFAYGDKREALSAQAVLMRQINEHCFGGNLDLNIPDQMAEFFKCIAIPPADLYLRTLGTYGVFGTIARGNGTKGRVTLVNVPLCGIVPDGVTGLKNNNNRQHVIAAGMSCEGTRRSSPMLMDDPKRDEKTGLDLTSLAVTKRKLLDDLERYEEDKQRRDEEVQRRVDVAKGAMGKLAKYLDDPKASRFLPGIERDIRRRARAIRPDSLVTDGNVDFIRSQIFANGWTFDSQGPGVGRRLMQAVTPGSVLRFGTCTAHSDCNATATFDTYLGVGSQQGAFCSALGKCDACSTCQWGDTDGIDKTCPSAGCPHGGNMPRCVDGTKLVSDFQCKDQYEFEVWQHHDQGSAVTVSGTLPAQLVYVTPFNRLVGPIMLSQRRRPLGECSSIFNPSVKEFANLTGCQVDAAYDGIPFGLNPVFVSTSGVYDGKQDPERAYVGSERINKTTEVKTTGGSMMVTEPSTPIGFFPHQYDGVTHELKPNDLIDASQVDIFKLYIDNRVSASHSQRMLQYLREGGFIDTNTHTLLVEIVTFNPNLNHFCFLRFDFNWVQGGNIQWDWFFQSVYVDIYSGIRGQAQVVVEVIVIIMLSVNCISQARDVMRAVRTFSFLNHMADIGNWYDILHLVIMWVSWSYWAYHYNLTSNFKMENSYPVLADPGASSRFFATNSTQEFMYLTFEKDVQTAADSLAAYSAITSCSIIFFILRLVKGLDFQEQMGLITRTISEAAYELVHFFVLFIIVFMGYVCTGVMLFGHQVKDMSTIDKAIIFLYFQIVAFDDSQFWGPFSHAAPLWAFYLWVWTFLFVVWLILFNILLAILIEGYVRVKAASAEARGVHTDIVDLFTHWCKSWMLPHKLFMSDQRLAECLEKQKAGMPSTSQLREALVSSLVQDMTIHLDGGIEVEEMEMLSLVRAPDAATVTEREKIIRFVTFDVKSDGEEEEEKPGYRDENEEALVQDLMTRYGDNPADPDAQEAEVLDHLTTESLVQNLAMFRAQQIAGRQIEKMEWQLERICHEVLPADEATEIKSNAAKPKPPPEKGGVVQVQIIEAAGLPKMDLFRSVDPYVLVFCTDPLSHNTTGAVSYRTDVKPRNRNPVWEEECEIPLVSGVNTLTATIFDKDDVTSDDLVGCVHVYLHDLDPGVEVDEWYDVVNPNMDPNRLKDARLHLKVTYMPTVGGVPITVDQPEFQAAHMQQQAVRAPPGLRG